MFPFATSAGQGRSSAGRTGGAQALLEQAPALKEAVERVIVKVVKSLQTMAGAVTTVEGMLAGLTMDEAKEVIATHGPTAAAGLLDCPAIGSPLLMTLDATLVHALVELLCGGNGAEAPSPTARSVTPIDVQFSQIVFSLMAAAIQTEWAEFGFGHVRAVKIEGGLPNDLLGPKGQDVAIVKLTIGAFGVHGAMRIVLPRKAIDRFARPDATGIDGPGGADPAWSDLFQKELGQANVMLDAYLDANGLTLAMLANLEVGQILALPAESRARVSLVSDDHVLYRGELGQADDLYSLRIEEVVSEPTKTVMIEPRPRRSPLYTLSKA